MQSMHAASTLHTSRPSTASASHVLLTTAGGGLGQPHHLQLWLIQASHAHSMRVHAWLTPCRLVMLGCWLPRPNDWTATCHEGDFQPASGPNMPGGRTLEAAIYFSKGADKDSSVCRCITSISGTLRGAAGRHAWNQAGHASDPHRQRQRHSHKGSASAPSAAAFLSCCMHPSTCSQWAGRVHSEPGCALERTGLRATLELI